MNENAKCAACDKHENGCCTARKKVRGEKEYKDLLNRLKRIEGQVRGVQKMLESDAYCPDIMIQVSAISCALKSFNKVLLSEHIRTCVADDIKAEREGAVEELVDTLGKLMR